MKIILFILYICTLASINSFHLEIQHLLQKHHIPTSIEYLNNNVILKSTLTSIHCISAPTKDNNNNINTNNPLLSKSLSNNKDESNIIHLHEDVYYRSKAIIESRLLAKNNIYQCKEYARKTTVKKIDVITAYNFLTINHLWGGTKAKYNYGIYNQNDELIAVASFSPRRNVLRNNQKYRSHELIRFCTKQGINIIGGISKLIKKFIKDYQPDDIITTIDRDFGSSDGWTSSLGFHKVMTHPPLPQVVSIHGERHPLVGAGLIINNNNNSNNDNNTRSLRRSLPQHIINELADIDCPDKVRELLSYYNYYCVYDAGVERLMMLVDEPKESIEIDVIDLFRYKSTPSFPINYYSNNKGISALLDEVI